MEPTVRSEKILQVTRDEIQNQYGSLDDLSYELANTVANIYYQFNCWLDSGPPQFLPNKELLGTINNYAWDMTAYGQVGKIILQLRGLRNQGVHPEWIQIAEEFAVSVLKYRIENAANKSPIRLKFERFLNRNKVNEIPNLVDLLGLR